MESARQLLYGPLQHHAINGGNNNRRSASKRPIFRGVPHLKQRRRFASLDEEEIHRHYPSSNHRNDNTSYNRILNSHNRRELSSPLSVVLRRFRTLRSPQKMDPTPSYSFADEQQQLHLHYSNVLDNNNNENACENDKNNRMSQAFYDSANANDNDGTATTSRCQSFINFQKKYSMGGVNGRSRDVAPTGQPQRPLNASSLSLRKKGVDVAAGGAPLSTCCGRPAVECGALTIAVLEFAFFLYQAGAASIAYEKTGDENVFAFTLTIFSFTLAMIAVVLMLIGIHQRSPYFLVPHLLMQFTIFSSAFALSVYFTLLLIGGTSITIDALLYEDTAHGEQSASRASKAAALRMKESAPEINALLIALLVAALVFFLLQVFFFYVVQRCYRRFHLLCAEKMSNVTTPSLSDATSNGLRGAPLVSRAALMTATDYPLSGGNAYPSSIITSHRV